MVPAGPVGMAVGLLFRAGRAYFQYFYIEIQGLAGQWVVGVDVGAEPLSSRRV